MSAQQGDAVMAAEPGQAQGVRRIKTEPDGTALVASNANGSQSQAESSQLERKPSYPGSPSESLIHTSWSQESASPNTRKRRRSPSDDGQSSEDEDDSDEEEAEEEADAAVEAWPKPLSNLTVCVKTGLGNWKKEHVEEYLREVGAKLVSESDQTSGAVFIIDRNGDPRKGKIITTKAKLFRLVSFGIEKHRQALRSGSGNCNTALATRQALGRSSNHAPSHGGSSTPNPRGQSLGLVDPPPDWEITLFGGRLYLVITRVFNFRSPIVFRNPFVPRPGYERHQ